MLVLSDCPDALAGLPLADGWSSVDPQRLDASDRSLLVGLGAGHQLWRARVGDSDGGGDWPRALIVRSAPVSQFDTLLRLLSDGLELSGPTICLALTGRFHGQHGREWLSAPGNLHLCAAFPKPGLATRAVTALPAVPALALVDAVRDVSGGRLRPGIKWVNDVLLDGRKIGGVLAASQTLGDELTSVVLGLGLNVKATPSVEPTPFVPAAGSLAAAGADVALPAVFLAVLAGLARRMGELVRRGPAGLLEAYRSASVVIGREVCVFAETSSPRAATTALPIVRGTVSAIADDLSLVLEGQAAPVSRGRLAFAADCSPRGG